MISEIETSQLSFGEMSPLSKPLTILMFTWEGVVHLSIELAFGLLFSDEMDISSERSLSDKRVESGLLQKGLFNWNELCKAVGPNFIIVILEEFVTRQKLVVKSCICVFWDSNFVA